MGLRWSEDDYQNHIKRIGKHPEQKPKKKSKYNAKRVRVDGILFDSQKEADYYCSLKLLYRAGAITGFCRQARFILNESDEAIEYVCDFIVFHNDGTFEVVDTKGIETDTFRLKHKLFKEKYSGLELKIVK